MRTNASEEYNHDVNEGAPALLGSSIEVGPAVVCQWETTPMGSLESLLRLRGTGIVRRAGLAVDKEVTQVQAGKMRRSLRACIGGYISVLELSN